MKTTKLLALSSIFALASCAGVNVKVDKTQAVYEDDQFLVVPSTAVTPQIDGEAVNKLIQDKINESKVEATK